VFSIQLNTTVATAAQAAVVARTR